MIADIVLAWNELTITLLVWFACVSLAVAADVGPEYYREKARERKARAQLEQSVQIIAAAKAFKVTNGEVTIELGAFKIQPEPARRRHARA